MDKSYQTLALMMAAISEALNGATHHKDPSENIAESIMELLEQLSDKPTPRVPDSGHFKKRLVKNILNDIRDGTRARRPSHRHLSKNIVEDVMEALERLSDGSSSHAPNDASFKRRLVRNILRDGQRSARVASPGSGSLSYLEAMVKLARRLSDDDDGDNDGDGDLKSPFPNLKYAMPKYNNVDSIVKHVGNGDGGEDGVKVTIMNFND